MGSRGSSPEKRISWSLVHTVGGGVPYMLSVCACRCMSMIGESSCARSGAETKVRTTPGRILIVLYLNRDVWSAYRTAHQLRRLDRSRSNLRSFELKRRQLHALVRRRAHG